MFTRPREKEAFQTLSAMVRVAWLPEPTPQCHAGFARGGGRGPLGQSDFSYSSSSQPQATSCHLAL